MVPSKGVSALVLATLATGCGGDAQCLSDCETVFCLADDACDGELGDDNC